MSTPIDLLSVDVLSVALTNFGVDISDWGTGNTRSVADFLKELQKQESHLRLYSEGLTRVVRVVKLLIFRPGNGYLVEAYQILPDGRRRDRQQIPSGKMAAHETVHRAVVREMDEELNLTHGVHYDFKLKRIYTEEASSKSYPNLRCLYELNECAIELHRDTQIPDGYEAVDKEDGKKLVFFWMLELPTRKA